MTVRPDSTVLLVLDPHRLAALQDSQRLAWLRDFRDDPIVGQPVVARDSGVFIVTKQHLYALTKDGNTRFQLPHQRWMPAGLSPERLELTVTSDSNVILCDSGKTCIKVDRKGEVAWRFSLPDDQQLVAPPAAGPNGSLYLRSGSWLHVVGSQGEPRWKMSVDQLAP